MLYSGAKIIPARRYSYCCYTSFLLRVSSQFLRGGTKVTCTLCIFNEHTVSRNLKAIVTKFIVSGHHPHLKRSPLGAFFIKGRCACVLLEFPETYKEQPFSVVVASKQSGPFQPCNLAAKLGEVAAFGTYLKFMVERPGDCDTAVKTSQPVKPTYTQRVLLACVNILKFTSGNAAVLLQDLDRRSDVLLQCERIYQFCI